MSEPASEQPEVGPSTNEASPVPQIRFVPHITSYSRSLHFDVLDREVPPGRVLKVGRYTDKVQPSQTRIAFKSKVVSRSHAEIWTENGQFFLRDIKSSSGTFLNQQRLSPPNQESAPHPLKDGDILQLGVDYQGGTQDVFRCVKIRLEINRSWQREDQNPFRLKALQTLEALKKSLRADAGSSDNNSADLEECCICLCSIAAFQALFVAPCSHTFHFKCIRRLLLEGPSFVCPLCRTYADLEADVCTEEVDHLVAATEDLSVQSSQPADLGLTSPIDHDATAAPMTVSEHQAIVNAPSPSPPALEVITPEEDLPSNDGGAVFPSEHQECRTPANPTPHLLFTGSARSMPTSRSLSVALPVSEDTGSTPASLLSPVGEAVVIQTPGSWPPEEEEDASHMTYQNNALNNSLRTADSTENITRQANDGTSSSFSAIPAPRSQSEHGTENFIPLNLNEHSRAQNIGNIESTPQSHPPARSHGDNRKWGFGRVLGDVMRNFR